MFGFGTDSVPDTVPVSPLASRLFSAGPRHPRESVRPTIRVRVTVRVRVRVRVRIRYLRLDGDKLALWLLRAQSRLRIRGPQRSSLGRGLHYPW